MFISNTCQCPDCKNAALSIIRDGEIISNEPGFCFDHTENKEEYLNSIRNYVETHDKIVGLTACGITVKGLDLSNKRFYGCNFQHVLFNNVHADGMRLRMCTTDFATFTDCDFINSNIQFSSFAGSKFVHMVLTDHDAFDKISQNTKQLVIDYLAAGIDPEKQDVIIYPHSYVPECNQLMLPFLTLVSNAELSRNPTVKEEIESAGLKNVNAGMYTYPIHQACDILFCKGNVVPVGKDQLPHLEMTRNIASRFNNKFCKGKDPVFPEPQALLAKTPMILGLDGTQKMSKSRNNAIMLAWNEDETAKVIKKATTDSDRNITYDPVNRPAVANLLTLISLCTGEEPAAIAARIGDGGGGGLKAALTEAVNEKLRPLRQKRAQLEADPEYIRQVLLTGAEKAREIGIRTLDEVREVMNMKI